MAATVFGKRVLHFSRDRLLGGILLAVLISGLGQLQAASLKPSIKKETVTVRLVGRASSAPVTSFGANYDSYVAAIQSSKNRNDAPLVKLVYRFLNYDVRIPASLLDYQMALTFRAVRQADCDESTDSLLYNERVAPSGSVAGRDLTFIYAKDAVGITIPADTVLPCYVVTPADYKGSKQIPARPFNPIVADKAPTTTPAAK